MYSVNINIEKMDNGWILYVTAEGQSNPGNIMSENKFLNTREIFNTLDGVLVRIKELI